MGIYRSIIDLIDALTDGITAWAETERTQTLEHEFDNADWGSEQVVTVYIEDDDS